MRIFNPSRIILGGGIMAQEYVLSEVNRKVKAQIAPGLGIVEIVPAKLANTAGMMGAVSHCGKVISIRKSGSRRCKNINWVSMR